VLRLILLLVGLAVLTGLIWHVGPFRIAATIAILGPQSFLVILLPTTCVYLLEAAAWRLTLGPDADCLGFGRLWAIRMAGEMVNMATPTAYVGGEPVKAYLLAQSGVPAVQGIGSVVVAKTVQTIAEAVFIVIGIALGFWLLGSSEALATKVLAGAATVGLLLIGTAVFVTVQYRGLFTGLLALLRRCRIRIGFLEVREEQLRALDATIREFYRSNPRRFAQCTGLFLLGWLFDAVEVYVILYYLDAPIHPLGAVVVAALALFVKGGTFFIPAGLGVQEAGHVALLAFFGYGEVIGLTVAFIRRVRELVWIAVGLLCLMALGGWRRRER
jgi:uncharacterized protein (TIRG00374 family)